MEWKRELVRGVGNAYITNLSHLGATRIASPVCPLLMIACVSTFCSLYFDERAMERKSEGLFRDAVYAAANLSFEEGTMRSSEATPEDAVTAAELRRRAAAARRLSSALIDEYDRRQLLRHAKELEALAKDLESSGRKAAVTGYAST